MCLAQGHNAVKLVPERMKKIHPKMNALEWSQHFSHYKSMGIFPDARAANSTVQRSDHAEFQTHQRFMVVFIACKNKEEPIKNERARVVTRFSPL